MSSPDILLELPPLLPKQEIIWNSPSRFKVAVCGRRFGKSRLALLWCVDGAANGKTCWWVAPSYKVAEEAWQLLKILVKPIPRIQIKERDLTIYFPTLGRIVLRSADRPETLVGAGIDRLVIDEAGIVKENAWNESLRPSLSDTLGKAIFIGTPKGHNWFWRLYNTAMAQRKSNPNEWGAWRYPTSENPYIPKEEIEAAKLTMPDRVFRQEYMAEFIADAGSVFRHVAENATSFQKKKGDPGKTYVFGIDWGKYNDFTCVVVMDPDTASEVYVDRWSKYDFKHQYPKLKSIIQKFPPRLIVVEYKVMGEGVVELLEGENYPLLKIQTMGSSRTGPSKQDLIENLELAFDRGEIKIINDYNHIAELQAFEMERLPSGRMRYSAPSGMHDDTVMALALCYHGVQRNLTLIPFVAETQGQITTPPRGLFPQQWEKDSKKMSEQIFTHDHKKHIAYLSKLHEDDILISQIGRS